MRRVTTSPYDLAERFVGMKEVPGSESNPAVLAMLRLDQKWPGGDEVPWCSAFVNYIAWLLRLPRSKSLRARSWLTVGVPVHLHGVEAGWDVVVLKRGPSPQPGPDVIHAQGHVGFYSALVDDSIHLLGGNQGDAVSVRGYPVEDVIGVRRLG